jgi:replication fork protection complex subunit Csm3/Swi3
MPTLDSDPANGLDNYDVDDFSDDPFASPPPEAANKKRKEPDSGLGIDEEVDVKKRARVPNVKLDEERCGNIILRGLK